MPYVILFAVIIGGLWVCSLSMKADHSDLTPKAQYAATADEQYKIASAKCLEAIKAHNPDFEDRQGTSDDVAARYYPDKDGKRVCYIGMDATPYSISFETTTKIQTK